MIKLRTLSAGAAAALCAAALTHPVAGAVAQTAKTTVNAASQADEEVASPGALPDPSFGPTQRAAAIAAYQKSAPATARDLHLAADSALQVKDVLRDGDGTVHVRYTRTYRGLPVIGGDLVVHDAQVSDTSDVTWDKAGNFTRAVDTTPAVSESAAVQQAGGGKAELVVWAIGGAPRLAWRTTVPQSHGLHQIVVTDAHSGTEIARYSEEQTSDAIGTGKTLYSANVPIHTNSIAGGFELKDLTRGGHFVTTMNNTTSTESGVLTHATNTWGNNTESDPLTVAADAQYGAAETWDFYQGQGRNGIRNDGVGARSRVHYDTNYDNAFWSDTCFCMSYGDGDTFTPLVPLDVAGHEMSHGVTSNTAGLLYLGESGGLNEATSDIMGTSVEFFAANTHDPGDYYIGEKIASGFPGGALRRMDKPSLDGASYDCYTPLMGRDDVHYTSGVANHFFYLLSQGTGAKTIGGRPHNSTSCNGTTFTGIGLTASTKIWYRALNAYLVPGSDYQDARDATVRAARDLFSSTTCGKVQTTWNAVKVPANLWSCSGLITPGGTNIVRNPGFEAAVDGASWAKNPSNAIGAYGYPRSGAKFAWLRGVGSAGTDSVSQVVTLPAGSPKLSFYLFVSSDEVGSTVFDTFKAQIIVGGVIHNVVLSNNTRWDNSYHRKGADLSAYAGQTVTLKFTATEDATIPTWFFIDDVNIHA